MSTGALAYWAQLPDQGFGLNCLIVPSSVGRCCGHCKHSPWVYCGVVHEITKCCSMAHQSPRRCAWFKDIAQIPKHKFGNAHRVVISCLTWTHWNGTSLPAVSQGPHTSWWAQIWVYWTYFVSLVVMCHRNPTNCWRSHRASPTHTKLVLPLVRDKPFGEQWGRVLRVLMAGCGGCRADRDREDAMGTAPIGAMNSMRGWMDGARLGGPVAVYGKPGGS